MAHFFALLTFTHALLPLSLTSGTLRLASTLAPKRTWLRETLIEEQAKEDQQPPSEPHVWRLEMSEPFEQLTLRRLSEEEVRREVKDGDEDRVDFLTREYYDWAMGSQRSIEYNLSTIQN